MPQLPNPDEAGQPGIRGRETPSDDRPAGAPGRHSDETAIQGRQPQHPGQAARWEETIGRRDAPAGDA